MKPASLTALSGVRVVVTRAKEQSGELIAMLEGAGAEVVSVPAIETVPPEDKSGIDRGIENLSSYDYAVFTSANSVRFLLLRMSELGKGPEELRRLRIVAVGPKTAQALEKSGLKADVIPDEFVAEGAVSALSGEGVGGRKFLYPRAETARDVLPDALRKAGAAVDVAVAYRTVAPKGLGGIIKDALAGDMPTVITFTSSSTVRNFLDAAAEAGIPGKALSGAVIACIGPVTAKTAEDAGLKVSVIPREYTAESLFSAIIDYFKGEK